ncbi:MAG: phosphatase PAP2 family protein [Dehalococcoidia bacterium]
MTEFAIPAQRQWPRWLVAPVRAGVWYGLDMVVVLGLFFLYFLLRGLPTDRVDLATRNAFRVINLEQSLGIFHEPSWQQAAIHNDRLTALANFTYLHLHMPLLVGIGYLFFLTDSRKHRMIRNTILLSGFLAVPIYAAFPVTPPRLMGSAGYPLGIFDTIPLSERSGPGSMANWYAAVPSYHFGWIALAVAGVWWCWKPILVRAAAVAFGCLMWWAIVVTGNHYFFDMVAGVCMVSGAFMLVRRFENWAEANPEKAAKFTVRLGPLRLPF